MVRSDRFALLLLVGLVALPFLLEVVGAPWGYWSRVFSSMFMLASLAYAQNVLLGYTGYPAFGGIAFFGIGGYATALMMKSLSVPFLLALPMGGVVSALFAILIAPPLMRLKSHYFAITTLALQLALGEVVANLEFTGGSDGINLPIYEGGTPSSFFYYLFLIILGISFLINAYVDRSVFGYALKAIREDEVAAESLGVNTILFKSASFGIMAFISGLVGGAYAYWITYIDPTSMFDPLLSVKVFVALLLGGLGSVWGALVGSFSLELVSELVWSEMVELHGVVLGLLIVVAILVIPRGIVGARR